MIWRALVIVKEKKKINKKSPKKKFIEMAKDTQKGQQKNAKKKDKIIEM